MDYKKIILKKGKEESLKRFHPWVFSGAIAKMDNDIEEGDLVSVYTSAGDFIAVGHFQIGSIAVRVLDFAQRVIGEDFFVERLQRAYDLRQAIGLVRDDNNAFRLVHGEGDFRLDWSSISMVPLLWCRRILRECTLRATSSRSRFSRLPAD